MPEVLSDSPSLQEILWNFSRFRDEKYRLTLRENPHFYEELPSSPEAYENSFEIYPTEDFRRADNFYVLTDKPEPVRIMTDQASQSFGNIWCPQNAIIFKGLGILFLFFPLVSDVFPDICGRLMGEGIVKASLKGTYCGFCEQLPVSTISGASANLAGLQPIITDGCSWTGWKGPAGCLPIHSSVDTGLRVCAWQEASDSSPVCCVIITHCVS